MHKSLHARLCIDSLEQMIRDISSEIFEHGKCCDGDSLCMKICSLAELGRFSATEKEAVHESLEKVIC
jgi:hypothetical protein